MAERASGAFGSVRVLSNRTLVKVAKIWMTYLQYRVNVAVIVFFLRHEISYLDHRWVEGPILSRDYCTAALLDAISDNWNPSSRLLKM